MPDVVIVRSITPLTPRRLTPLIVSALATLALTASACSTPTTAGTGTAAADHSRLERAVAASAPASGTRDDADPQVLAISIDAFNPKALRRLGHRGAPTFWRLVDEGASTLNARTQRELTVTLPNHTSMVTGRRIKAAADGHGVTWNDDLPGHPLTVQAAAGHDVESLFSVAHQAGLSTALYSTKTKFSLFQSSWPESLDRTTIKEERDGAIVKAVRRDLLRNDRGVTFMHLGLADKTGHAKGFMSPAYLRAVRRLDGLVGRILQDADTRSELDDLTIVLTSDHGGMPGTTSHSAAKDLADYRVPFTVWGPGIAAADLYDINPGYRDPHRKRTRLAGRQPVRNGDVANVVLGLVGAGPVPGSLFGFDRPLRVTTGPS